MSWTKEDIVYILKAFDESTAAEFSLDDQGTKLKLKKSSGADPAAAAAFPLPQPVTRPVMQPAADENTVFTPPTAVKPEDKGYEVRAALAGIFYRASSSEAEPYVREGSKVRKGDVIGLIEAMKVMSEITSPVDGTVRSISALNGVFAEFNAVLMIIEEA